MPQGPGHLPLKSSLCSHPQYHAESIANVREAVESIATSPLSYRPVAIALDTKGPEIRTGILQGVRGDLRPALSWGPGRGPCAAEAVARRAEHGEGPAPTEAGRTQSSSGLAPRALSRKWS